MALEGLLETATASALIKDGAAVDSLAITMRQQLQQAGVLQQLAGVMTALAAGMRSGAADIAGKSAAQLCDDISCFTLNQRNLSCMACLHLPMLHRLLRDLWGSPDEKGAAISMLWLCDASGYAEATMQLCNATLQHVSSVLQHMLPIVQMQQQQASALLLGQQAMFTAAMDLAHNMVVSVYHWKSHCDRGYKQQWQCSTAASLDAQAQQRLQQLLLSPHCPPFFASLVLLTVSWFIKTCLSGDNGGGNLAAGTSSSGSGSRTSSSSGRRTSKISRQSARQQQGAAHAAAAAAAAAQLSSNRDGAQLGRDTCTPCQLKLFELLGLSPQLTGMMERAVNQTSQSQRLGRTSATVMACICCCDTFSKMVQSGGQQAGGDPQRWRFEQQLWLLLPSVLLPCASSLLLPGAASGRPEDPAQQQRNEANAVFVLNLCSNALVASNNLQRCLPGGNYLSEYRLPHPAWMKEVLGGVLQPADQLLLRKGSYDLEAISSSATGHSQGSSSSTPNSSSLTWRGGVAEVVLGLLLLSLEVFSNSAASPLRQLMFNRTDGSTTVGGVVATSIPIVPDLTRCSALAMVYAVVEAGLRLITTAVQQGAMQQPSKKRVTLIESCLQGLVGIDGGSARSFLGLHLGRREPELLKLEQQQLYSLLSTLQKLGALQKPSFQAGAGRELCWGQKAANRCCWDVGEEAAALLGTTMLIAQSAAAERAAPAAVDQQYQAALVALQQLPEVEFLPSLVIFGRCCKVWAEQLQHQAPEVLQLLGSGAAAQQQQQEAQQGGVQVQHSAAQHGCVSLGCRREHQRLQLSPVGWRSWWPQCFHGWVASRHLQHIRLWQQLLVGTHSSLGSSWRRCP
jgi:hypothetical protein